MTISPEDAQIILDFFHSKIILVPFIRPSVKKIAEEIPDCAKKYTLQEILDLLTAHYD